MPRITAPFRIRNQRCAIRNFRRSSIASPKNWTLDVGCWMFAALSRVGPVAQRLEQGTHNPLVPGSNPGGPSCAKNFAVAIRYRIRSICSICGLWPECHRAKWCARGETVTPRAMPLRLLESGNPACSDRSVLPNDAGNLPLGFCGYLVPSRNR